jgi:N6-L-threonylcarbamoyladenine synthase
VVERTRAGLRVFRERFGHPQAVVVAGGVGANQPIRRALQRLSFEAGLKLVIPEPKLCTDNGAMIAWAGIERLSVGLKDGMETPARARWPLDGKSEALVGSGRLGVKV